MREVVEYCTVIKYCKPDIDYAVNAMLRNGWELFGQPSFVVTPWEDRIHWTQGDEEYASRFCFVQVMVRYKKEEI